ncbi:Endochitinase B1 [Beauveria bassiana]|nr:Endochitinase B1 [Beauveria bassiana]
MDTPVTAPTSTAFPSSQQMFPLARLGQVMYMNAVYYHNGHIIRDETPAKLDYGCINLVYYAYASVAPDGIVNLGDEWADIRAPVDGVDGGLGSLMQLKQQHRHLKVLLSIGGPAASGVFVSIASTPATRHNFAHTAAGLVMASGLDGVDISWNVPADPAQGDNFLLLLQAVRNRLLGDKRLLLTAALPANPAVLQYIDMPGAARALDFMNLQTYNLHHAQPGRSLCPSQLYALAKEEPSVSTAAGFVVSRNFPAQKILLGIPTFGVTFPGCDGPAQEYDAVRSQTVDYLGLPVQGRQEGIDRRRISAYCAGGEEGFIAYDNPETVKEKAEYCKQKGYGGLFYSNVCIDVKERSRSLVTAGFVTLHSS